MIYCRLSNLQDVSIKSKFTLFAVRRRDDFDQNLLILRHGELVLVEDVVPYSLVFVTKAQFQERILQFFGFWEEFFGDEDLSETE
jgi:hypothetical protein